MSNKQIYDEVKFTSTQDSRHEKNDDVEAAPNNIFPEHMYTPNAELPGGVWRRTSKQPGQKSYDYCGRLASSHYTIRNYTQTDMGFYLYQNRGHSDVFVEKNYFSGRMSLYIMSLCNLFMSYICYRP